MRTMSRLFVVIEGIDGTGKSTVCRRVADVLRTRGIDVAIKPEFPDGDLAEEFKTALTKGLFLAEHLAMPPAAAFFYLAYAQVVSVASSPAATIILCDRYLHTLAIYQSHFVKSAPAPKPTELLASLEHLFSAFGLPLADVVFLLEASLPTVSKRLAEREERAPSSEEEAVLLAFQEIYRHLGSGPSASHFFSIDAERDISEVASEISSHIVALLEARPV